MNTSGLLTYQGAQSVHDSVNIPKNEIISYIYILI